MQKGSRFRIRERTPGERRTGVSESGRRGELAASQFQPGHGLFYVNASRGCSEYYIFDNSEKPEGWSGNDRGAGLQAMLQALDYKTGKIRWSHKWDGTEVRSGVLTTAGNLLFTGDPSDNFVALNAGRWHRALAREPRARK